MEQQIEAQIERQIETQVEADLETSFDLSSMEGDLVADMARLEKLLEQSLEVEEVEHDTNDSISKSSKAEPISAMLWMPMRLLRIVMFPLWPTPRKPA